MEIKYKNTKSDVESATSSLYSNSFYRVSIFLGLIVILIFAISFVKEVKPPLGILYVIIALFLIAFIRFYIIPVVQIKRNLKKQIESNPNYFSEEALCIKEEGFEINSKRYNEPQFFTWQSIKYTYSTFKYHLIILHNGKLILINKTNSQLENILPNIIGIIEQKKVSVKKQKSSFNSKQNEIKNNKPLYWIGFLGIIPNVGVIVGVILSIIGVVRRDLKLIIIGIADILFTVVFWTILAQVENSDFIKNGFNKLHIEMTQSNLNDLVKHIEFYKTVNGQYPEKLKQIENKKSFLFTNEIFENQGNVDLYYKTENGKYILKSFGPDTIINTNDDIYPTLDIDSMKIGLRKKL